jgi:RNA methyltransferase, TrmH family
MSIEISSLQNNHVKQVVKLSKRRYRDVRRLTVVEGLREVSRAWQQGIQPSEVYLCPPLLDSDLALATAEKLRIGHANGRFPLYEVTSEVYAKMAYRGQSGGILLVIPYLPLTLSQLSLGSPPFLAIIEGAEKPGNLGAILRTADAAGVDAVIVAQPQSGPGTDLHNPNVIRASLGTLFNVPVAAATTTELIPWLQARQIQIMAATPAGARLYTAVDMTQAVAVVSGSEAHGLSRDWLAAAAEQLIIPMVGQADSLNLATATALLLYEVVRQRSLHAPYQTTGQDGQTSTS